GGGVGARRAADGRLVDLDHFVEEFKTLDGGVRAGIRFGTEEALGEGAVNDVVDQRRFAAAADTGDDNQRAQREFDVDGLEVVLARAADDQAVAAARAAV